MPTSNTLYRQLPPADQARVRLYRDLVRQSDFTPLSDTEVAAALDAVRDGIHDSELEGIEVTPLTRCLLYERVAMRVPVEVSRGLILRVLSEEPPQAVA